MTQSSSFTVYKGFRIYLPEESSFATDFEGRYFVHAELCRVNVDDREHVPIPECRANTFDDALLLSMSHAMHLVEDGFQAAAR